MFQAPKLNPVLNYLFKLSVFSLLKNVCFAMFVAGRLGPVIHTSAVYFTVTILQALFVNVDLCLGVFLLSLSFQFRMQLLHCLHLQYTTTVIICY